MCRRLGSILAKPYTFFVAPDVFISYARLDGTSYAEAIAAFLADPKRKFSCHIDQWDTTPGVRIPSSILRAARRCHAAVIVGSSAALASWAVHAEVKELKASKRTIVLIELPSSPLSTAIWYPLIKGIAPVRENGDIAAVLAGKPSQNVCNRLENAFTFWRRNKRIQSAAWAGAAVLAVAATASVIFNQQAVRSRSIAQATEKSIRALDMLLQDPTKSMSAMRLALDSFSLAPTSWGESTLRRALLLMPSYQGSHQMEHATKIDGSGNLVTWRDAERNHDGETGRTVAVSPDGAFAVVINDEAELWSLGQKPVFLRRWALPRISSAAFSADNKSIYAVRDAELIVFSATDINAEPKILSRLEGTANDARERLFANAEHLAVQIGSKIRTWNIAEAKWDHEIDSSVGAIVVLLPGDRLADWSSPADDWSSRAVISDLSAEDGVDFISGQIHSDCGQDRGRQIQLQDFSISKDGSHAVMACGNGIVKVISTLDGAPVASAPFENQVPSGAGIDGSGKRFFAFFNGSGGAFVSEWINTTRSSPQIGGGEVARLSRSLSLSRNGTVAGVFRAPQGSKLITFNSETLTLSKYAWSEGSSVDDRLTVGQSGKKLAFASGGQIEIANLGEKELAPEGTCPVRGSIIAINFGADDNVLAASGSAADGAAVTVCRRTEGRWESERTLPAASWTVNVRPDPIALSPVAVSAKGSVAYLGRGTSEEDPGRTINV